MIKITLIFAVLLAIISLPVLAENNFTIQSDNEQIISIINLNNFSTVSTNSTNQTINLSYDNYIIKLTPSIQNINNQTFVRNMDSLLSDRYQALWIFIIISLLIFSYLFIKNL